MFEVAVADLIKTTIGGSKEQIEDQALKITRGEFQGFKTLFGTDAMAPIESLTLNLPGTYEDISFPA